LGPVVTVSEHAWRRYCERVGPITAEELARLIAAQVEHQVRRGLKVRRGCAWVRLPNRGRNGTLAVDVWAVLRPEAWGYHALTVYAVRIGRRAT